MATDNADTKTGGTYMYIHSYQIHNVLNDYRKQLSHGTKGDRGRHPKAKRLDRISISRDGQCQTIMEKISSEIVARITESGPDIRFEASLTDRLTDTSVKGRGAATDEPPQFRYTVIDENNRKQTNTLTIQQIDPSYRRNELAIGNNNGNNMIPESDTQQGK